MLAFGAIETVAAGHFPLQPLTGSDDIRQSLTASLEQKAGFDSEVNAALAQFPNGVSIDDLYTCLSSSDHGVVAQLAGSQFPKMPSFLKLTLLNFCRQHALEAQDATGHPVFRQSA